MTGKSKAIVDMALRVALSNPEEDGGCCASANLDLNLKDPQASIWGSNGRAFIRGQTDQGQWFELSLPRDQLLNIAALSSPPKPY